MLQGGQVHPASGSTRPLYLLFRAQTMKVQLLAPDCCTPLPIDQCPIEQRRWRPTIVSAVSLWTSAESTAAGALQQGPLQVLDCDKGRACAKRHRCRGAAPLCCASCFLPHRPHRGESQRRHQRTGCCGVVGHAFACRCCCCHIRQFWGSPSDAA
jgi:hypothetical protein